MKKELQHFISCLFNQNDHLVPQINETLTYYIIRQNKTPQILKLNVSTKKHLEHFNLNTLNISTENNLNITTENTLIISTENNLNITTKNPLNITTENAQNISTDPLTVILEH